jgi:hypothetical protein
MAIISIMVSTAYLWRSLDKRRHFQYTNVFVVSRDHRLSNAVSEKGGYATGIKYIV